MPYYQGGLSSWQLDCIVSRELKPLHPCIMFLGSCLVLFVSLRAYVHLDDKTEFTCLFYCVFGVVVFTGLIRGRVLTIFSWAFSNLLLIVISIKIVLALVASFPTNLVSSNSESVCRSCVSFGSTAWSGSTARCGL